MKIGCAADRVDPDHLGAKLAQRHPAQRRGDEAGNLDDGGPGQAVRSCRRRLVRRPRRGPGRRRCTWSPARSGRLRRLSSRASVASIRPPVAPTGWPSEIPEPCTFVRSRSAAPKPHSRITASACAANASLSSMTSMSLQLQARLGQRELGRRHRADAHHVGRHAGRRPTTPTGPTASGRVRRPSPVWSPRTSRRRRSARWRCPR